MTSPIFFIVSTNSGKLKSTVGVFCADYLFGRPATPEESAVIKPMIYESGTVSLRDALIEGTYANGQPIRVWDTRKEARQAAAKLNDSNTCFDWLVVQVGKEQRDLSRKPVGYQITFNCGHDDVETYATEWNPTQEQPLPAAALEHDGDAETLYFTTRAKARTVLTKIRADYPSMGYTMRTLYA